MKVSPWRTAMLRLAARLLAGLLVTALLLEVAAGAPVHRPVHRIGVLAHRPKPQMLAGWRPLAEALTRSVPGCEFTVEVLDYPELEAAIDEGRLDLVITNPGHYVGIRSRLPGTSALATVIEQGPGLPLPRFGGTIVARAGRADLQGLADLAGARIAAVSSSSLGGYQAQAHELVRSGHDLPRPDHLQLTGVPHEKVVELVLAGRVDAGFVRSGTIEIMAAEGRLDQGQLKVINRQPLPEFPYAVSTRLFPEWPVVALAQLDEDHARRIAGTLLVMEHGAASDQGSAFHGFTIPADYAPVEQVLRDLRLPPFDAAPAFSLADVLRRYRLPITLLVLAALTVAALAGFIALSNRRLARARRKAEEATATLAKALAANEATTAELREALSRVKQLSGLLPICMYCHKIRTDQGYWDGLEGYISAHSEALFSHGICPTCLDAKYPEGG